ncbi:MAG: class I SAM-dependent methyltransferase [Candidatus Paceibacterota bacterium]|jgi:23S rRNA (guanine745-N1)-methyltransferase
MKLMDKDDNNFYKKSSRTYRKYEFHGQGRLTQGEQPNFFEYLKKHANRNFNVLDVGCGSGELTLKLSPYFKKIIGIDPFKEYIKTAKQQKKNDGIKNVTFRIEDGRKLPFKNEYFDIIFSSRGPLSADINFMNEGSRVLKKEGIMFEETIGEKDKSELKKIFGRGQNYPIQETKLKSVKKLLKQSGMKLIESKYFLYYQIYPSINEVIEILERAPIIPHFNKIKDKIYLENISKRFNTKSIKLSSHRLHWMARK